MFVSYTGTVYPTEIRVTQLVQRCARVYVQAGIGLAQHLRCEPFDAGTPGSVATHLDQVASTMEREWKKVEAPGGPEVNRMQSGMYNRWTYAESIGAFVVLNSMYQHVYRFDLMPR